MLGKTNKHPKSDKHSNSIDRRAIEILRIVYKHQTNKLVLRHFKLWQANTIRHELKTICSALGQTI
jgi:hypothetical protein